VVDIRVLVTGGTGYLAGHIIKGLLAKNYKVRATLRKKTDKKCEQIRSIFPMKNGNLELFEADLLQKECWFEACKDIDYVMHVASPFFFANQTTDMINTAV